MTGDNSPRKDKKSGGLSEATPSRKFRHVHHTEEGAGFLVFGCCFFLMWFSNLPFFYMIIYMVYLLALQKVSPSHPTKISKGNTFSPLKDTTLRRTLGHTKARVPDLLSVNDNAMLDACATATRAFDTQDDSHGDAGTLIVFGAPTYLGLFCHFFIHFLNRWHQVWSKWLKLRVLLSGAGVLSHWSDGRAKVLWISLSLSFFECILISYIV